MAAGGGEKGASEIFGKLTGSAAKEAAPSTKNKADTVFMVRQTTSSNRASKRRHIHVQDSILPAYDFCTSFSSASAFMTAFGTKEAGSTYSGSLLPSALRSEQWALPP